VIQQFAQKYIGFLAGLPLARLGRNPDICGYDICTPDSTAARPDCALS
jgi:hypothetical protein